MKTSTRVVLLLMLLLLMCTMTQEDSVSLMRARGVPKKWGAINYRGEAYQFFIDHPCGHLHHQLCFWFLEEGPMCSQGAVNGNGQFVIDEQKREKPRKEKYPPSKWEEKEEGEGGGIKRKT